MVGRDRWVRVTEEFIVVAIPAKARVRLHLTRILRLRSSGRDFSASVLTFNSSCLARFNGFYNRYTPKPALSSSRFGDLPSPQSRPPESFQPSKCRISGPGEVKLNAPGSSPGIPGPVEVEYQKCGTCWRRTSKKEIKPHSRSYQVESCYQNPSLIAYESQKPAKIWLAWLLVKE